EIAVANECILQRGVDIEVHRVAELVGAARGIGLDAGGEIGRVVAAEARLAQRTEKAAQRLEAEEVDALFGELELDVAGCGARESARAGDFLVSGGHL